MSTRAELRALVLPHIGNRTDKTVVINEGLEDGLSEAMKVHAFKTKEVETDVSISDGSTYAAFPSNTLELVEARLIDGTSSWPITIKDKKWLVERWPNVSSLSTNKPVYAYEEGDKLYLYPISNGSYTVRMTTRAKATFSDVDGTENPVPLLKQYLVRYAVAHVFDDVQLFDFAAKWEQKAATSLALAIRADTRKPAEVKQFIPHGYDIEPDSVIEPYLDPFYGIEDD